MLKVSFDVYYHSRRYFALKRILRFFQGVIFIPWYQITARTKNRFVLWCMNYSANAPSFVIFFFHFRALLSEESVMWKQIDIVPVLGALDANDNIVSKKELNVSSRASYWIQNPLCGNSILKEYTEPAKSPKLGFLVLIQNFILQDNINESHAVTAIKI